MCHRGTNVGSSKHTWRRTSTGPSRLVPLLWLGDERARPRLEHVLFPDDANHLGALGRISLRMARCCSAQQLGGQAAALRLRVPQLRALPRLWVCVKPRL